MHLLLLIACTGPPAGGVDSTSPAADDTALPGDDTGTGGLGDGGGTVQGCIPDEEPLEDLFVGSSPEWTAVAVGSQHSCGLRGDGQVECWGYDWDGRATVPELPPGVLGLAAGSTYSCALLPDGSPTCWGADGPVLIDLPAGPFVQLHGGYDYVCGLDAVGAATCWGDDEHGQLQVEGGPYVTLSTGRSHACGLDAAGTATCWGAIDAPAMAPPPHEGEVVDYGQADVPDGSWLALSAGDYHTCAVDSAGAARCWGRDRAGELDAPAGVELASVAAGGAHSCGVGTDGAACCWGGEGASWAYHQAWQPAGPFSTIVATTVYSCGLRFVDGAEGQELVCWGALGDLPVQVP